MVADAKLWGRVVELSSPLHYFSGFWWQLLFNVEKAPTPPDAPPEVADAGGPVYVMSPFFPSYKSDYEDCARLLAE